MSLNFKRLTDLAANNELNGKRVFIRADLNVPQDDAGNITDDTRIRASIPAIELALKSGAAVMVTSHLGRPTEGEFKPEDSLDRVAKRMSEIMKREEQRIAIKPLLPLRIVLLQEPRTKSLWKAIVNVYDAGHKKFDFRKHSQTNLHSPMDFAAQSILLQFLFGRSRLQHFRR